MTYIVNYTNDSKSPIIVENKGLNDDTSLKLVGKNYPGYGEIIAENFIHLLEHFANSTPPSNPKEGQLWYNPNDEVMSVYTASNEWKSLGNVNVNTTNPTDGSSSSPGNIWVNTTNNKVFVYTGFIWLEISTFNEGNGLFLNNRFDNTDTPHMVLELYVNFEVIAIISSDAETWILQSSGSNTEYIFNTGVKLIDQYPIINNGINLNNLKNTGITSGGTIEADVLKANTTEGNWIASQQDISTLPNAPNNKIMTPYMTDLLLYDRLNRDDAYRATEEQVTSYPLMPNDRLMTPLRTDQLLFDRISRDDAYRATLEQAIKKSGSILNDRLMTPFLTRKAYENYVDGKINYDTYQKDVSFITITAQDTWENVNAQIVDVYANRAVFYSYNIIMFPRDVTELGIRLYDITNDVEVDYIVNNYTPARTATTYYAMSEHYSYIPTSDQTIELQLQFKMTGTSVDVIPSHIIKVSRAFERII